MRLWPDLLFSNSREVNGHAAGLHCDAFPSLLRGLGDDLDFATLEPVPRMGRVRALCADWRPA